MKLSQLVQACHRYRHGVGGLQTDPTAPQEIPPIDTIEDEEDQEEDDMDAFDTDAPANLEHQPDAPPRS